MHEHQPHYPERQDPPASGTPQARAAFTTMESARSAIQRLEDGGIPSESVSLSGGVDEAGAGYETERRLFSDVTRSVLLGGVIGAVLGGVLGALIAIPVEGIGLVLAAVLGAVFGAGVGGSAGGLGATKYNSPAWAETYEAEPHGDVVVVVAHADAEVVDDARRILASAPDEPA